MKVGILGLGLIGGSLARAYAKNGHTVYAAEKDTTVEALPMVIEEILERNDTVFLPITEETVPVQHVTGNNISE